MTAKIVHYDRGLDHTRLEKLEKMLEAKKNDFIYRNGFFDNQEQFLIKQAITEFNLQPHYDAIEEYQQKIKELNKQISQLENMTLPHKVEIAKIMSGTESIYDYERFTEGSPVAEYIAKRMPDKKAVKEEVKEFFDSSVEKLWLAADIMEARSIFDSAVKYIDSIKADVVDRIREEFNPGEEK